jgi:rRNA maturation endonuclease Nob1
VTTKLRRRRIWNFQCRGCKAEAPVFFDNELCQDCDPDSRCARKPEWLEGVDDGE